MTGVMLLAVVAAQALAVLSLAKVKKLDAQLTTLASQQRAAAQDTRVTKMQAELATLRRQLTDNGTRIAGNRQTLTALQQKPEPSDADMTTLAQQAQALKVLTAGQESLKTRISTLEEQLAIHSPLAAFGGAPVTPADSAASAQKAASATKRAKSTAARHHPSTLSAVVRASSVPFVLTDTERRGAESVAAIAPKGYTSLAQIALIGEGETVAGWTLVHAGDGQATFRVNGRTVRVSAH
jgi:hypothetical protein